MRDVSVGWERNRLLRGALGGLGGGAVFGYLMATMGMIPMIAALVGSTSTAVGWAVHLAISLGIGVTFGAILRPVGFTRAIAWGLAAGLAMWALGAMVTMRLLLGMPIAFDPPARMSLMGHALFGLALGLVFAVLSTALPETPDAKVASGP